MTMIGQEKASLEDLAHHGVKGMHWGVRKNYKEVRNAPTAHLEFTTSKGHKVSLDENQNPVLPSAIAAISPRFRNAMERGKSFTISADGKKVGNAQFHEVSKDELNLVWLGVNKNQRGKGYASAVFESGVEYGKQNGYKALTLEVPGNAPDAQHIYAKNGFKVSGKTEGDAKSDPMWGGLTPMSYNIENPHKVYPHVVHAIFDADEAALEKAIQDTYPDDVLTNPEKYASPADKELRMAMIGQEKPSLDELSHHGVKGMKWGVRRAEKKAVKAEAKAALKNRKALTEKERADFYQAKADRVLKEAMKGENTLIALKHPGDAVIVTGKQFVEHMSNGGLMDITATDIYATRPGGKGPFVLNDHPNPAFVPSHEKIKAPAHFSSTSKRVIEDYNSTTPLQFWTKYGVSKKTYSAAVAKGDPNPGNG